MRWPTTDGIVIGPTDFPYRERRDSAEAISANLLGCDDYGAISVKKLVRIDLADISRERGLGHLCHDVKQPATNTAQEALSMSSIGNKGLMFLSPSDP